MIIKRRMLLKWQEIDPTNSYKGTPGYLYFSKQLDSALNEKGTYAQRLDIFLSKAYTTVNHVFKGVGPLIFKGLFETRLSLKPLFDSFDQKTEGASVLIQGQVQAEIDKRRRDEQEFNPYFRYNPRYSEFFPVNVGGRTENISILTPDELMQVFNEVRERKDIPFEFPIDGCYARAHIMSDYLAGKGINTGKIFSQVPFSLSSQYSLNVATSNVPSGNVRWGYHVAPIVYTRVGGELRAMVLDPSINPKFPLTATAWFKSQTKHIPKEFVRDGLGAGQPTHDQFNKVSLYITDRFVYSPGVGNVLTYGANITEARVRIVEKRGLQNYGKMLQSTMRRAQAWK